MKKPTVSRIRRERVLPAGFGEKIGFFLVLAASGLMGACSPEPASGQGAESAAPRAAQTMSVKTPVKAGEGSGSGQAGTERDWSAPPKERWAALPGDLDQRDEFLIDAATGQDMDFASALDGSAAIVNVWATWCEGCREEMADISAWASKNKTVRLGALGATAPVRVLGVALDDPQSVREFLSRSPVSYPTWVYQGDSAAFLSSLGNEAGALPYTLAIVPQCLQGNEKNAIAGKVDSASLDQLLRQATARCASRQAG